MRKVLLVLAAAAIAVLASNTAFAKDMKGMWGPGVSVETLPLDVKFGVSPKASVFVGLSYRKVKDQDSQLGLGGGLDYALFGGDDYNFNFQPAIRFYTGGSTDVIEIPVSLSVEAWMNSNVSVEASHGLVFRNVSPEVGDSATEIFTDASSVTAFRFRYWFTK